MIAIEFNGAAAGNAFAGGDLFGDAFKKSRTGVGIGIDKNEPIAGSGGCAGVSGAGDLVDRFKDHVCSGSTGDFRGFVRGIVVADDEFRFPAALMEGGKGGVDVAQGFAKASFFVEGWDDGRDFQWLQV